MTPQGPRQERETIINLIRGGETQKRCNGKPLEAVYLYYKSHDNFVGKDKIILDVDPKIGRVRRYTFTVDVR